MTIAERMRQTLERLAGGVLMRTHAGRELRAADVLSEARLFGRFLRWMEVPRGGAVGFVARAERTFVVGHAGTLMAGRMSLPLAEGAPEGAWARQLATARPRLVMAPRSQVRRVRAAAALAGTSVEVLEEELFESTLAGAARAGERAEAPPSGNEDALVVFTSGTTGEPKGAVHTQDSLAAGIAAVEGAWRLAPTDHQLLALPLHHVHGLAIGLHAMLALGVRTTLADGFDADAVLATLADRTRGFTVFFGVPTMHHRLAVAARGTGHDLRHLRLAVSGSAPLAPVDRAAVRSQLGVDLLERYGLTETLLALSQSLDEDRSQGGVGEPLPGVEVRIAGPNDEPLGADEVGEIQVRGASLFRGYLEDAPATAAAFTADGWYRTGDIGSRCRRGRYRISGRAKDLIISGGENVHPLAVEVVLAGDPAVAEVAVIGVPDAEWGERVCALVVPHAGRRLDIDLLAARCREHLAPAARPREYRVVSALPRNAMGKLARHLIDRDLNVDG